MDWFLMATAETAAAGSVDPRTRPGGQARHIAPGAEGGRLDLAVARAVERHAETVLAGVQVAALFGPQRSLSTGAVLPGGSPTWLAADLDLLVQLVRLSAAAGVVLPHGVAGAPGPELVEPVAQLAASRDCYRDVIEVLSAMSVSDEVPPPCRDDALRLLRQVERRVQHLDDGHPAVGDRSGSTAAEREFIPGELLG
jgi:hypothetical protein